MMTVAEYIELLKAQDEFNIGVVPMIHADQMLQRLISTWSNVARLLLVDTNPTEEVPTELEPEYRSRWVWSRIEPDPASLWITRAGYPVAPHTLRAVQMLQDNAVVFPDGTMSEWAVNWLKRKAKNLGVSIGADAGSEII